MRSFNVPFADVRVLAGIISYQRNKASLYKDVALRILYTFAENKPEYGQVRLLNVQGDEIIRINREQGRLRVVPERGLQSKAHRGYFKKSQRLGFGEVYVSPLDLNIENKKIEVPYVPVIRFVTPVFNDSGERSGFVVLNFYAAKMLAHFLEITSDVMSNAMLLNNKGFWLVSDDKNVCWAFMFEKDEKKLREKMFGAQYPVIWKLVQQDLAGQVQNRDGLFTWATVNPVFSVSPKIDKGGQAYPPVVVSPYHWVVMQHVSIEKLAAMKKTLFTICAWGWGILSTLTGVTLWSGLLFIQRNRMHREELEVQARQDWLTGLANLPNIFAKLEKACESSKISNIPFYILYIDLDDFKFVNDRYGHESGNIVLRHVASVLRKKVRFTDTVARIGGDEYVILLENMRTSDKAKEIAADILTAFDESPVVLECGSSVYVKASIGIAGWSRDVTGPDDLMKRADVAMYDAKKERKKHNIMQAETSDITV
ncbi:diguanylate cyclase [Halodesulfovibrio aestuarii]|uniref:sensor domain-containing diguanylate cyclase n=1 Tax=Halodesulfovibrio aestuarii TaxID=126333 RepID=UPI003522BE9B